ncbi:MAG TPA: ATP-binding protein, partial [Tepidisphaeraceae bacterium]|nr:ATP-binding protein [Tepidisphaeraceae bacterium]
MTRRITLAILLTTWATLVAGGVVAYLTVRWALVAQLDHSLVSRAGTIPELSRPPTTARRADRPEGDSYVIRTADGRPVSPPAGGRAAGELRVVGAEFSGQSNGERRRVLTLAGSARLADGSNAPVTVVYQSSAAELDRLLDRLALTFGVFGVGAGLVTALAARVVSRAALRPLRETADVIGTIEANTLDRRIDAAKLPPEMTPVAGRLNEMLARIERAYAQRQQFLADASHELRTPVAALVTTAEVTLRRPREAGEYAARVETMLADARLLRELVERLMEQCRADALSHDEPQVETDLAPLLAQCADQAAALGLARGVTVARDWPTPCPAVTQIGRLRSVIQNLVANAVAHNRLDGSVELVCKSDNKELRIEVRDTGPGIAAEHLPHLFEPFYRVDKSRSHEAGHMGLGLALVKA